jgi:hypothetical protein
MNETVTKDLTYTKRFGVLAAQQSIQNVWDVLVELITNADESYGRLFRAGAINHDGGQILLEVEPHRGASRSTIRVSDRAQGIADLDAVIEEVGKRTSTEGDRGFMGRGLKDCASLGAVVVESIHEGAVRKGEITENFKYISHPTRKATDADRKRLSTPHNGTVVTVLLKPDVSVPRADTLTARLPWHFALRDILSPEYPGRVLLRYAGSKPTQVLSELPDGILVYDEEYVVPGYPDTRARFQLYRASEAIEDLNAGTKFSRNGVLVKGVRGIFECSFLADDLSRDPGAERYFGRLDCPGIDRLAREYDDRLQREEVHLSENPRLLLDPNRREGLVKEHPFVSALYSGPIDVIKLQLEKEREQSRKQRVQVEAKETTDRLRKLAKEASRFMREKLEDFDAVGVDVDASEKAFAERGIRLVPPYCQLAVGDERRYCVKTHPRLALPIGTAVIPVLGKRAAEALELAGEIVDLEADPMQEGVLRGFFSVRAKAPLGRVQVGCQVDGLDIIFAEVETVESLPRDLEIPEGFTFARSTYTVAQGKRRTLRLHARLDQAQTAGKKPMIKMSRQDVILRSVSEFKTVPGTTYEESTVEVEGRKLQGHAEVTANFDGHSTTALVTVKAKEEEGVDLKFELVPYSLGKNYRAVWDRTEPNKLLITTKHESISRYLGPEADGFPGQHRAPFRVLLAELISDNICRRIVDEHLKGTTQKADSDYIYTMHNRLMKEFTPIAHKIQLANPNE